MKDERENEAAHRGETVRGSRSLIDSDAHRPPWDQRALQASEDKLEEYLGFLFWMGRPK